MTVDSNKNYLIGLLNELRQLPKETEWVEFKGSYADPREIGEYVSALSNSAALWGKAKAFLVWGIDNQTHEIVGTAFRPEQAKKGNEELENWLLKLLNPRIHQDIIEEQRAAYGAEIMQTLSAQLTVSSAGGSHSAILPPWFALPMCFPT